MRGLSEQVLDPTLEPSDLRETYPARTVELFNAMCRRRVNPDQTVGWLASVQSGFNRYLG